TGEFLQLAVFVRPDFFGVPVGVDHAGDHGVSGLDGQDGGEVGGEMAVKRAALHGDVVGGGHGETFLEMILLRLTNAIYYRLLAKFTITLYKTDEAGFTSGLHN